MKKRLNGIIAVFTILSMLLGLVPVFQKSVQAASTSNVGVVSYRYNESSNKYELTVTWNSPKTTKSVKVEYYTPENTTSYTVQNLAIQQIEAINATITRFNAVMDVTDFNDDIIYGLKFTMYDGTNSTGNATSAGFLYFMTKMSFYSLREEQVIPAGVFETGTKPELKLRWNIPKVWDGAQNAFVYATTDSALSYIRSSLGMADSLTDLNFRINISTKAQALDSGPDITPVIIDGSSGVYTAGVLGNTVDTDVTVPGEMSFNLLGRKDSKDASLDSLPAGKLPHKEILPGTVYFMNIKPVFTSTSGTASVVSIGDPSKYNGSMVTDEDSNLAYTFTPIRFQLSRDASDNIYAKVYRINKDDGSLDMPNLYYSIQAIDTPGISYGYDWPEKAKMTDEFFPTGSDYAITVISGINPGTSMYYKIVVKTDSKRDRIESLKLQYQMSLDTSKPPVPIDLKADNSRSELNSGTVIDAETGLEMKDANGNSVIIKSTNAVLTWTKPKNWDSMTAAEKAGINYHILLNTYPSNLDIKQSLSVNGVENEYLLNYRWVKMINGNSSDLQESTDGTRLEYVLNGRELFKNSDGTSLKNLDKYPTYLMENTIYYVKMFSTKGVPDAGFNNIVDSDNSGVIDDDDIRAVMVGDSVSDKSVAASFTTLPRTEKEVPVATGFKAISEDIDTSTGKNNVTLQFSKVNVDWTNYTSVLDGNNKELYDLYMSTSSDASATYVKIGSTDGSGVPTNIDVDNVEFLLVNGKMKVIVSGLRANTTYYFKLQTRLDFSDTSMEDRLSAFTAVVPITTRRGDVEDPDEATRKPVAPVDFEIAKDSEGELELTGSSVAFDWTRSESDVTYKLIATTFRISSDAVEDDYVNDAYYQSFAGKFGDQVLSLNPVTPDGSFSYDAANKICKYRVEEWMVPNSLYYFSIKAERKVTVTDESGNTTVVTLSSDWVTIPVTTSLIDAPKDLEAISDLQLGVNWTDSDLTVKAEDYKIYIKKSDKTTYTQMGISQATIVRDTVTQQGVAQFYGRIRGLDADTEYDVRVYKGQSSGNITYQDLGTFTTRDDYHQLEISWKGISGYTYEIALKTETEDEYSTIDSTSFDLVTEKNTDTVGTGYYMYYARIETAPVSLTDGTTKILPLKSNTKYYIKVRATLENIQPSKYAGPVTARTQFNQDDYDDNEDLEDTKAKFIDRIEELEENLYWRVDKSESSVNKLLLKGDRVENALENSRGHNLTIDISPASANVARDIIYVPSIIFDSVNSEKNSITLKTTGAQYTIKPDTLKLENVHEVKELEDEENVKDIFFKITITRSEYGTEKLSAEVKALSSINDFELIAIGSTKTDAELKEDFYNKVYNSDTGLVKQKMDEITNQYNINSSTVLTGDYYINYLVEQVELELSTYIKNEIEGGGGVATMINATRNVKDLTGPMTIAMAYKDNQSSFKTPYAMFDDSYLWQKLSSNVEDNGTSKVFRVLKTGKYVITAAKDFAIDLPSDHWAREYIVEFSSKYDLGDVFGSTSSFSPDASISIKEIILLYEKVAGKTAENAGIDIKQKAKKLGLDAVINASAATKDLSRQEAASVIIRLYCLKEGLNPDKILSKSNIHINDDKSIESKHYANVSTAIDLKIFSLNDSGDFLPDDYITRAEIITAIVRVLKLTGEL